jgi:hypothetical protein
MVLRTIHISLDVTLCYWVSSSQCFVASECLQIQSVQEGVILKNTVL